MKLSHLILLVSLYLLLSALIQLPAIYVGDQNEKQEYNSDYQTTNSNISKSTYANITNDINSLLSAKELNNTKFGLAVFSTKLNSWIYTRNSKQLLVPASNTKLITTFTNYELLNGKYHITTSLVSDGDISNGTLNGNLYIIGRGDALLSVGDLEIMADELKKMGIKSISGSVCGDASFFDSTINRFHYSGDRDEVQAIAPITALPIEKNIVTIIIKSGSIVGKPVSVQCIPASSAFIFSNTAVVSGSPTAKSSSKKKSNGSLSITTGLDANGNQIFYIKGGLQANKTYSYKHYIKKPASIVAAALRDRLIAGGITVIGSSIEKKCNIESNKTTTLYEFNRPLNEMINLANKNSDNYIAETLFKLNGAIANKDKNTAKSASISELQTLENNKIGTNGLVFYDGSGLSRRNKITPEALTSILIQARYKPYWKSYYETLSIAGVDGTLYKRMKNSFAENNLHGKTGTHSNISSLAGLISTRSGDTILFAYIFNGNAVGLYKQIENQICMKMAEY